MLKNNRTYGDLYFADGLWKINNAEPHICVKLKDIFKKIGTSARQPFNFVDSPETCHDLLWFTDRYPLKISAKDLLKLKSGRKRFIANVNELESILIPSYKPENVELKNGYLGRDYQIRGTEILMKTERLLIGDEIGLGKTLIGILAMLKSGTLPAIVVVQTHLPKQWKDEIQKFTGLRVHLMAGTRPYSMPDADVYITKYSCLAGWTNYFEKKSFKMAIFDEVQELRREQSDKYKSAKVLSSCVKYCLGLSASPIYNYGDEIFNVIDVIKDSALGRRDDFLREWTRGFNNKIIKDPQALGTYLRESFLFLKRTRKEVNRELPPVNKIVHTVAFDEVEVQKAENIAKMLAIKVTSGTFFEQGSAARELDIFVRHSTGVAKAKGVAEYAKILLENDVPIILAGWHRDVYDIWLRELAEYKPVMYTGSESPNQKESAKSAFLNGDTNLFIISLRSGVGLDGLQSRCSTVLIGELDWSPEVHNQLIGRANRDGQESQVTAIYLVSDCGSDPVIIDLLGLKASQSYGIVNPNDNEIKIQYSDESRIKILAERYLEKHHKQ